MRGVLMWNVTEIFSLQNDFPVELRLFHVGLYYWVRQSYRRRPAISNCRCSLRSVG